MATTCIDILNNYYSGNNVYKSLIICETDKDAEMLANLMEKELYTVCKITINDLQTSDTPTKNNSEYSLSKQCIKSASSMKSGSSMKSASYFKLWNFNTTAKRVIIISYNLWEIVQNDIELYILPEQNLIVLQMQSDELLTNIYTWIDDTMTRGFITRYSSYLLTIQTKVPISLELDSQESPECPESIDDSNVISCVYINELVDNDSCVNYNILRKYI